MSSDSPSLPKSTRIPFASTSSFLLLIGAAVCFWTMAILNFLSRHTFQTDNTFPDHSHLEFAPIVSAMLSRNVNLRSLASLNTYLQLQNVTLPQNVDLGMAVNLTGKFVVTPVNRIFEKMNEETEKVIIVIGTILTTMAIVLSAYGRVTEGK